MAEDVAAPTVTVGAHERPDFAIATVMARKGARAELSRRLYASTGIALADRGVASGDGCLAIGIGPDAWLLLCEDPPVGWLQSLESLLEGVASMFDQSSAYVLFRLSGRGAETLLQKGVFVDLDPSRFPVGCCVSSTIAKVPIILWRSEADVFECAVTRSYRSSFQHWLVAATTASGMEYVHASVPASLESPRHIC